MVQRGAHNYAGPNCPGKGWTCTTAKRVLQIAKGKNDDNNFVCAGGSGGTPPGDCTIFQFSSSGADNNARCVERSSNAAADQNCAVTQFTNGGNNSVQIQQQVDAKDGVTQSATQYGGVRQTTNGAGKNDVQINQDLKQSVNKDTDGSGTQTQDGHQQGSVTQQSDTGNNTAQVDQSLAQKADACLLYTSPSPRD